MNNGGFRKYILIAVVFMLILLTGRENKKPSKEPIDEPCETITVDEKKFKKEYESVYNTKINDHLVDKKVTIPEDNNIVYATDETIVDILKNEKAIVYFGFNWCPWCRSMIEKMFEVADRECVEKIYYYDFYEVRQAYIDAKSTDDPKAQIYEEMMAILGDSIEEKIEGTEMKRLGAPTIFAMDKGKVLGMYGCEPEGYDDPSKDMTEEQVNELNRELTKLFKLVTKKPVETCSATSKC